ncbi:MAG: malto-oligosyltrehalose trehalohydrolase, partial [Bacteroidota bacterium]
MEMTFFNQQPGVRWNPVSRKADALFWAPEAKSISVDMANGTSFALEKAGMGFRKAKDLPLQPGDLYHISINHQKKIPDPASLAQPEGVHGPSQLTDIHTYPWPDKHWKGLPLHNLIIYELHTGAFTPEGTFSGIAGQLDQLKELGIDAIELMPVAHSPGARNWGYDGVFPFAVHQTYGGAHEFQKLVDACHSKGLAVILDVVYNHLGPEGSYIHELGPLFTDKYQTPWGDAINFDDAWCDGVRHFFIQNALMWLRDFHIDGLRLDAVHAIKDMGVQHFLTELKKNVEALNSTTGRHHFLIAECDLNDVRYINPFEKGGYNMDAQWCDEFHHGLHALVTNEKNGYYSDFGSIEQLVKSYNHAYVYNGIFSPFRKKIFGTKTTGQPGNKFVVFAQNHDQTGNRIWGERLSSLISFEMQKVIPAVYLLSPFVPMLFMGEEYGEKQPFLYFTSHSDPDLIKNVQEGRKNEFKDFIKNGKPPNPQSEETFLKSKLTRASEWSPEQKTLREWYKTLIAFRKTHPCWQPDPRDHLRAEIIHPGVMIATGISDDQQLFMYFNFGKDLFNLKIPASVEVLLFSGDSRWGGESGLPAGLEKDETVHLPGESMVVMQN